MDKLPNEILYDILIQAFGQPHVACEDATVSQMCEEVVRELRGLRFLSKHWAALIEPFLFSRCKAVSPTEVIDPQSPELVTTRTARRIRLAAGLHLSLARSPDRNLLTNYKSLVSVHVDQVSPGDFADFVRVIRELSSVRQLNVEFADPTSAGLRDSSVSSPSAGKKALPLVKRLTVAFAEDNSSPLQAQQILKWFPSLVELEIFAHSAEFGTSWTCPRHFSWTCPVETLLAPAKETLEVLRLQGSAGRRFHFISFLDFARLRCVQLDILSSYCWSRKVRTDGWPPALACVELEPLRGNFGTVAQWHSDLEIQALRRLGRNLRARPGKGPSVVRYLCPAHSLKPFGNERELQHHQRLWERFEKELGAYNVEFQMSGFPTTSM